MWMMFKHDWSVGESSMRIIHRADSGLCNGSSYKLGRTAGGIWGRVVGGMSALCPWGSPLSRSTCSGAFYAIAVELAPLMLRVFFDFLPPFGSFSAAARAFLIRLFKKNKSSLIFWVSFVAGLAVFLLEFGFRLACCSRIVGGRSVEFLQFLILMFSSRGRFFLHVEGLSLLHFY